MTKGSCIIKAYSTFLSALLMILVITLSGVSSARAVGPGALPTGGQVTAGQGIIAQNGNAMTVTQQTDKMVADWSTFSIGQNASVTFQQPSVSSVALNRVMGQSPSQIYGNLSANGQVFLVNPAGVYFGPTARVDVGGLVTSSLNLSNENFLAGRYQFENGGSAGAITNLGTIRTAEGGYVAFLSPRIANEGAITAIKGMVAMAAGEKVNLDFTGDSLINFTIDKGAIDALVENKGLVKADGGMVMMTAKAADYLTCAVVNNEGVIEARTLDSRSGRILLLSDMETGKTVVGGKLDASAPNGGDGGFIETSAAKVTIKDDANVTTKASNGNSGTWLIDPKDFTIASSGGDMTGAQVGTALGAGNVTIQSTGGATEGNGDIFVNDSISWSANTLTLNAIRNIEINQTLDGSVAAKLALLYGQGAVASGNASTYSVRAPVNLPAGANFSTTLGSDGVANNYTVLTTLAGLQNMGSNLAGYYALGTNVNAGGAGFTPVGSDVAKFTGRFDGLGHTVSNFTINTGADYAGFFGYTLGSDIRNVGLTGTGSIAGSSYVGGLVGYNGYNSTITNCYVAVPVSGSSYTGGLVGYNGIGDIYSSYTTGAVSGSSYVGGLVGFHSGGFAGSDIGMIYSSFATGNVTASANISGGLVGRNDYGSISNSYATGNVVGTECAAGLVGYNFGTSATSGKGWITNSYSAGTVTGCGSNCGGMVGYNQGTATITASYWNTTTSGWSTSAAGTGKTATEMKELATFSGWDITASSGNSIWRIYAGNSYPLLRSFLTTATAVVDGFTAVYNGSTTVLGGSYSWNTAVNTDYIFGTPLYTLTSKNVGVQAASLSGLYSSQLGYDIAVVNGIANITPKDLVLTGATASNKVYDGTTTATVNTGSAVYTGLVAGDAVTWSATGAFANKNVGAGKTVTLTSTLAGADAGNYNVSGQGTTTADITPKSVTASYTGNNKVYDGTTAVTVNGSLSGGIAGDAVTFSETAAFTDKNAGVGKTVNISDIAIAGADAGNYLLTATTASTTADISQKAMTLTGIVASNKVYDGTTTATVNTGSAVYTGLVAGDTVTVSATGTFTNKNAGAGKTVTLTSNYAGADVGNYSITDQASTTADITTKNLTASYTASNKTYNGAVSASVTGSSADIIAGDTVTFSQTSSFTDKNAGTNKIVNVWDITLGGADAGNYSLAANTVATTANITKAGLTLSTTNVTKTYDGNTSAAGTATVTTGTLFGTDTVSGGTFAFANKNAGTDKTVMVSGITVNDDNAGNNYNVTYADNTGSTITPKALTITPEATKIYDGNTTATVTNFNLSGMVGTESLGITADSANYDTKTAGTGKTVAISGIHLADGGNGGLASNYSVTGNTTITNGVITKKALAIGDLIASDKVYDGTTTALTNIGAATLTGVVAGDAVTIDASGAEANFVDKNVGVNKAVAVMGLAISGADAVNYDVSNVQTTATADITPKGLSLSGLTASNKVYDGTTTATVNTGSAVYTGLVAGDAVTVSATGLFDTKDAGTNKTVTLTSNYAGADVGNYAITDQTSATADIIPKTLTVTANNDAKQYSGQPYSGGNGVVYDGFASGEDSSVLSGHLTYGGDSQGAINAGTYSIDPQGFTSSNYTVSFMNGHLTIAAMEAPAGGGTTGGTTVNETGTIETVSTAVTGEENGDGASVPSGSMFSNSALAGASVVPPTQGQIDTSAVDKSYGDQADGETNDSHWAGGNMGSQDEDDAPLHRGKHMGHGVGSRDITK